MAKRIEAEGQELVLRNGNGDVIIVPKNKRKRALNFIKAGNHKGIDRMASKLPSKASYAEEGSVVEGDNPFKAMEKDPAVRQMAQEEMISKQNELMGEINPDNRNVVQRGIDTATKAFKEAVPESFRNVLPIVSDADDVAYFAESASKGDYLGMGDDFDPNIADKYGRYGLKDAVSDPSKWFIYNDNIVEDMRREVKDLAIVNLTGPKAVLLSNYSKRVEELGKLSEKTRKLIASNQFTFNESERKIEDLWGMSRELASKRNELHRKLRNRIGTATLATGVIGAVAGGSYLQNEYINKRLEKMKKERSKTNTSLNKPSKNKSDTNTPK